MKRILFAINQMPGGGAERVLLTVLQQLDRSQFEIELFLLVNEGVYIKEVPGDVTIHYLLPSLKDIRNPILRLYHRIKRSIVKRLLKIAPSSIRLFTKLPHTYDIGVSFCEGLNALLFVGMRNHFKTIVSWIHIDIRKHRFGISLPQWEKILQSYNKVVFVSNDAKNAFQSLYPSFDHSKLLCLYNPIDCDSIKRMSKEPLQKESEDSYTIISVGRLSPQKRFDRLIRIQKRLTDNGFNTKLLILGEGKRKEPLKQLITELKMEKHVTMMPFQKNPYNWMQSANLFVLPSDFEGLPLVISEAMLLELPIIATRTVGTAELLENGKYGLIVDICEDALYDGIVSFLKDPNIPRSYQKRLAENQGNFIFDSSVKKIESFFLSLT